MNPSALAHLKVLDLTRVRAGPTCCRVLADFGADVVKIEAPAGGDPNAATMSGDRDGYDMQNLHRSKRSMTLDLKSAAGQALFRRLVARADVVVENFRPDVKDRLGFDYRTLAEHSPRIILASISGFGQDGPYARRAGFDQIAQGMGGLMAVTGLDERPVRAGAAVADFAAGLYAALGVLIALAERERSGRGQWVHTSLLEAQIAMMDFQAARYLVDGEVPGKSGNDHPVMTPMGVIETADGHLNIGVAGDGQWRALCRAIGRPDLGEMPDFATVDRRLKNRPAVWALLRPIFRGRSSADWLARLEAESVPAGPIYRMDEVFADPQVIRSGIAVPIHHPRRGDIRLVGQPLTLSRTPAAVTRTAPDPGEHTDEILAEFGLSPEEIAELRRAGAI